MHKAIFCVAFGWIWYDRGYWQSGGRGRGKRKNLRKFGEEPLSIFEEPEDAGVGEVLAWVS
jgi:hypothetical protein